MTKTPTSPLCLFYSDFYSEFSTYLFRLRGFGFSFYLQFKLDELLTLHTFDIDKILLEHWPILDCLFDGIRIISSGRGLPQDWFIIRVSYKPPLTGHQWAGMQESFCREHLPPETESGAFFLESSEHPDKTILLLVLRKPFPANVDLFLLGRDRTP